MLSWLPGRVLLGVSGGTPVQGRSRINAGQSQVLIPKFASFVSCLWTFGSRVFALIMSVPHTGMCGRIDQVDDPAYLSGLSQTSSGSGSGPARTLVTASSPQNMNGDVTEPNKRSGINISLVSPGVCSYWRKHLVYTHYPASTILPADHITSRSTCDPISPILSFSRRVDARRFFSLDGIFERWRILIWGWSRDQRGRRGGKRSECEFFVRYHSLRSFSAHSSLTAYDPRVQHRGQKEQEDGANADADDESCVLVVGSKPIPVRGLVLLSKGKPSSV